MKKAKITITKAIVLFEYGKANKRYWNRPKLYQQVVNKALSIPKAFYPDYVFLFLFGNATSHSIYADNALYTLQKNKRVNAKQFWLCNG